MESSIQSTTPPYSLYRSERMEGLDATQIGEVGEHFVASVLGGFGLEVFKTNGKGFDLLVMGDNPIRVDVKTKSSLDGQRIYNIKKGKTTNYRDFNPRACDIFALVCLEDLSLSFHRSEDYAGKRSIYVNAKAHSATDPYESWVSATDIKKAEWAI
jgi:hypothetical protein